MRKLGFTFIGIALVLSLLVAFGQGVAHEQGATVLEYIVHLEEGEHRRDIDFGVICTPTESATDSCTLGSTSSSTTTTPDDPTTSSPTPTTVLQTTTTTSLTTTTFTQAQPPPPSDTPSTPTTRNKTTLALVLLALSYWLFKRRVKD